jgi:hypothetical protein
MSSGAKTSLLIPPARAIAAVAGGVLLLISLAASAQETKPAGPAGSPPPARSYQPGMFDSVGRWFKDSFSSFNSSVQGARDTLTGLGSRASGAAKDAAKEAADVTKDAAEAVKRLPTSRVVAGRERCAIAANGAPDCQQAAEHVCRSKGFGSGASLDVQSAQKCPARVWLSGRSPEPGDCALESFVTRAVCQ